MRSIALPSGQAMPVLGLGTWPLSGAACRRAVKMALDLGYAHLDTASFYGNHREIGQAIREIGARKSDIFLTTKVWPDNLAYEDVLADCEKALRELQVESLDLYLIHWPSKTIPMEETFRALALLVQEGKAQSIGVSNFTRARLARALEISAVPIAVNQVEYHPYLNQQELLDFCQRNGVALTAYTPLARGRVLKDRLLRDIAKAHGKSPVQVALRWLIQKGIIVIPKASSAAHLKANRDIFDWELSADQMSRISAIKHKDRITNWSAGEFDD